ncbi:TPA: YfcC family protein [Staphylococcus aureus]|nr:YfcC family protein [Staphylococcus aureus]HCV1322918.1 YfcC family protein [Staphylococcus aureus]HCV1396550.1 YfcC family protein [Staphylococcus aureus]HCV1536139.1 YfcC family protein [Staphylococcus aureus]HCV1549593.1 YfcC family protein [Staphylococcus aureus]
MENTINESEKKKRFKLKMPGAFMILFILTVVAVIATWVIPAGAYSKLSYEPSSQELKIVNPHNQVKKVPGTQQELDKMGVKIKIEQFKSGAINKPVSIPNTYERLKQHPAGPEQITSSMVEGTIEAVDIMVFILVLGGLIGVVQASGSFESGLLALTKKTKGHEFMLIVFVSILMIIGGTLCGIEEEAVAFYPILVPIFIALGYDSIVSVGAIFLASSVGSTFSTINPFSVVIASNAAGTTFTDGLYWRIGACIVGAIFVISYLYWYCKKIKKDPKASYSYEDKDAFEQQWSVLKDDDSAHFTLRKKIILTLFVLPFPIMVWGVMTQGWWFPVMASAFLIFTIIIMFIAGTGKSGLGEKGAVDAFVNGASSLVGVSLIIGLARGINLVLNEGMISDTILHFSSSLVQHMSGPLFIIVLLFIFFCLGFIVPSSSGLAVLSMPIFAPLADTVGIPRFVIVTTYQFGQYAMLFLAPTGLVMATLQMLNMRYSHWFRFVWPVVAFVLIFGGGVLITQVLIYS